MSSIAKLQKDECLTVFFDGTEFCLLSSYAQSMAMAMMESPMIAIRRHLQMRGLTDEGTRPTLIVRICSQYDNTNKAARAIGPITEIVGKSRLLFVV